MDVKEILEVIYGDSFEITSRLAAYENMLAEYFKEHKQDDIAELHLNYANRLLKAEEMLEKKGVTASYDSKKEAEAALNELFQKFDENLWGDSKGNRFHIEKNTKEYR